MERESIHGESNGEDVFMYMVRVGVNIKCIKRCFPEMKMKILYSKIS